MGCMEIVRVHIGLNGRTFLKSFYKHLYHIHICIIFSFFSSSKASSIFLISLDLLSISTSISFFLSFSFCISIWRVLICFLVFPLTSIFDNLFCDPLPLQLLSKNNFFWFFWNGVDLPPSYLDNVFKYTVFFWRHPLAEFKTPAAIKEK